MSDLQAAYRRIDEYINQTLHVTKAPGMSIALTDRDKLLRVACYGYADAAARTPVRPDTLFEIGSISKSFTAISLMRMREQGKLDLHAPITKYIPWFSVKSQYDPITVHNLLSHTAGISRGNDFSGESRGEVWALRDTETFAPPGKTFYYSNAGYKTLGILTETLYGQHYRRIIEDVVLRPLGMDSTDAVIDHNSRKRMAVGYRLFYDDRPMHLSQPLAPATWLDTDTGDGSIASTPADMAAYVRMLLSRGLGPKGRIMSEESFALMTSPVIATADPRTGGHYGYGISQNEVDGHKCIGHGGGMVGYLAYIYADLDAGLGTVVLTNGILDTYEIGSYLLSVLRAAHEGKALPDIPAPFDGTQVENAADYAGTYRSGSRTFTLVADGGHLVMEEGGKRLLVERQRFDPDAFVLPYPGWELFSLRFGRKDGQVVEAMHGPDWFPNEKYDGPATFEYPKEWDAYVGHYRSYNPWVSNFRIFIRKGMLVGNVAGMDAPLVPDGEARFHLGPKEATPEHLTFGLILDGKAYRATFIGGDYYRTFTP
jgi:CubicO group peptidase (beta-lactamase class C family)